MDCGCPLPCCWDTFVPVNKGSGDLVVRASGNTEADMESLRRETTRPYVPSGTLERYFPPPLNRWVPAPLPLNLQPWWLGCKGYSHVPTAELQVFRSRLNDGTPAYFLNVDRP